MIRLIECVFFKILGLATLKYFKSGTYYISSASPIRTTGFYVNQDFLNDHHVSLEILTFKGGYHRAHPRLSVRTSVDKTKWMVVFR